MDALVVAPGEPRLDLVEHAVAFGATLVRHSGEPGPRLGACLAVRAGDAALERGRALGDRPGRDIHPRDHLRLGSREECGGHGDREPRRLHQLAHRRVDQDPVQVRQRPRHDRRDRRLDRRPPHRDRVETREVRLAERRRHPTHAGTRPDPRSRVAIEQLAGDAVPSALEALEL